MSRYAAAHANPQGLGDARPTAIQIIKDEAMEGRLTNKVIVITGTSSGIGIETVRALGATGARLFLTARDLAKAKTALGDIFDATKMELIHLDQTSFNSVRAAAAAILSKTDQITILITNAAIMAIQERQLTEGSYELQFTTNHLSHFLFFNLLKPALLAGSSADFQSRVVVVASAVPPVVTLNSSDNYHFQKGGYTPWGAYAQSKLANIYMANEIERRFGSSGLHATSLHPGIIATGLAQHLPAEELGAMLQNEDMIKIQKSVEQGAATTVWAAISRELEGKGGLYLNDCAVAKCGEDDGNHALWMTSSCTYNVEDEARLWKDSLDMVGLSEDH
ncbi:NAD(P)-binding protein [Penicillium odoratum]|uniref:NAD(P)-binding protein n=1 Tax=Penicillium odoratum TaxID=1167516 RepID=UPI0025468297|nr:NAD(P)-binding protein [Penicillium odoratum]KAJ5759444.1 NAD(P)-binding protein [Penicillium odoratum]